MRTFVIVVLVSLGMCTAATAQVVQPVDADRHRIQTHLATVEAELRTADVAHLTPGQREARSAALDALGDYWRAGVFPHNEDVAGRNPVFIDADGRACAVGHLLIVTGHADVAERIAEAQNLARVPAIEEPELLPWLQAYGFTLEEAARIQPGYCHCGFDVDPVCGSDGQTYENACTATECRGVTVASVGECSPGDEIVRDCDCSGPEPEPTGSRGEGLCSVTRPGSGTGAPGGLLALCVLAVLGGLSRSRGRC